MCSCHNQNVMMVLSEVSRWAAANTLVSGSFEFWGFLDY